MPWVVRDTVDEINRAVGRRWQDLNPLSAPSWSRMGYVRCGPDGRCGRPHRCGEAEC